MRFWRVAGWIALSIALFSATLALRIQQISTGFWMLRDQIRDWDLVQRSFFDLPLVGPATHVGGYTIGPAFYWILWLIRVTFGPWFEYLPHGGGIGQAALQSAVDVLLLFAVWRRTRSVWSALLVVTLVATAGFDVSLAGIVWNPIVGSTLAKAAIALVLLDWHRATPARIAITAAIAWMAVHAYTGAVYVTVAVMAAILVDPIVHRDWRRLRRHAVIVVSVVLLLQVPYVLHQISIGFADEAMGAVSGGLRAVLTGEAAPQVGKSIAGLMGAFHFIQIQPWAWIRPEPLVVAGAAIVAVRFRRDPSILLITLAPPALAIVGYALFLGPLDHYYYFSLMPSFVLTLVLAATSWRASRAREVLTAVLFVGALLLIPGRYSFGMTMNRMPEYDALVRGSRVVANRGMPMRAIETAFALQPTCDPEFLYRLLGGDLDRSARWIAVIDSTGRVTYKDVGGA